MDKGKTRKTVAHLEEDIRGYKKQIRALKKEIREDQGLKRSLKGTKNGKEKSCTCKTHKRASKK